MSKQGVIRVTLIHWKVKFVFWYGKYMQFPKRNFGGGGERRGQHHGKVELPSDLFCTHSKVRSHLTFQQ